MSAPGRLARLVHAFTDHPAHGWVGLLARLLLAGVFLAAAWPKILRPAEFAVAVATYDILPLRYLHLMAIVLPWVELVAGVLLVLGLLSRPAALLTVGMNAMFIVALTLAIRRQIPMASCGCFSTEAASTMQSITWSYVWRDVGLLVLGIYVALLDGGRIGLAGLIRRLRRRHAP
jgi:putative oxidoreductase